MKTSIIKKILFTCVVGSLFGVCVSSCKKLDEYNPASLSEENVLTNFNGWKAYQSNCYTGLWGSLIGMPYGIVSETGTDLWTFPYSNHNQYKDVMAYEEFTNSSGVVRNVWDFAWGPIKDCNKTIQLAPGLKDGNASDIKILVAEFGSVPLILTDDPVKTLSPKRDSVPKIYAQIVSDLRSAFNNLPVNP